MGDAFPLRAAWLSYRAGRPGGRALVCDTVVLDGLGPWEEAVRRELRRALAGLGGAAPQFLPRSAVHAGLWVLGPDSALYERWIGAARLPEEGFQIQRQAGGKGEPVWIILGGSPRGALYGVFHWLRLWQLGEAWPVGTVVQEAPAHRLRMLNHWDNLDGSIERGYAGRSLWFRDGDIRYDTERVRDYARLLASVGINAVSLNNVNVGPRETRLVRPPFLGQVAELSEIFRAYGIRVFLSVNFASPVELGELPTADPLQADVIRWWRDTAALLYSYIPDFGGFVVKADSEFRPGPFTYGRTHADGANMLAEALSPFGGIVLWRCFVYQVRRDWRDRTLDRAREAYDLFAPLDGQFLDNVMLQIKNGPMDFQVREPVSPLLGALEKTNVLLELQITQEYTGQQRDLCFLAPQWKAVLDFDTYAKGAGSTVARVTTGILFDRPLGGMAGVANVGDDPDWTGHPLAQANLYAFGRLAWNPALEASAIAHEWTRQTLGPDPEVEAVVERMLMTSWAVYESYTAPLGVGWMVNPGHHYGPNVDGYEYSHWGTYHYADHQGIGVDRTRQTGTGFSGQYRGPWPDVYDDLRTCPDELLLFFHHVPYTHRLHSGKTVIQHIYDSHFAGVEAVQEFLAAWESLRPRLNPVVYERVHQRLEQQLRNAEEWRDVVTSYFWRKSGIADERRRRCF
ncbi:MAG: alpha-glucuronidase family glycosyl hydrolase [Firmicutes bacterium]|nr:alpha-glucuronidase family glycosyl hydrolase [Bacillota bacterium]